MYEYNTKVVHIVDGDTVDVDIDLGFGVWLRDERVRIAGIDAPESRTSDKVEKVFGLAAKDMITNLLSSEKVVMRCSSYDSKGKFGRILGDFVVYDSLTDSYTSLASIMVREGHAVVYDGASKEDIQEAHLNNRNKLIANGTVKL